ncbi:MAG: hypothetical protein JO354_06655 [Verrucomicrobia bacterium]|nr:hypothetical protein [Verrucomicrobiota bacterium]
MIAVRFFDGTSGTVDNGQWKISERSKRMMAQTITDAALAMEDRYIPDKDYFAACEVLKTIPGEILSNTEDDERDYGFIYSL